ncbi:MAG: DNA polymerase beta domain protein region [Candidatus Magasanikbacteria bacterium]|nr:DNA polymerase beta domain protein region [Candidatus Magasanikbacteria bacterium]
MSKELKKNLRLIQKRKDALRKNYAVRKIGIFGSIAKGTAKASSDVDVLVEFAKPIGFFRFIELEDYLSAIFKKKVDLVTKDSLKPLIKQSILNHVVYA